MRVPTTDHKCDFQVAAYYGSEDVTQSTHVEYVQLKHSTVQTETAETLAGWPKLQATNTPMPSWTTSPISSP